MGSKQELSGLSGDCLRSTLPNQPFLGSPAPRPRPRRPTEGRVRTTWPKGRPCYAAGSVVAPGWENKTTHKNKMGGDFSGRPATGPSGRTVERGGVLGRSPGYSSGSVADRPALGWSACRSTLGNHPQKNSRGSNEATRNESPGTPEVAGGKTTYRNRPNPFPKPFPRNGPGTGTERVLEQVRNDLLLEGIGAGVVPLNLNEAVITGVNLVPSDANHVVNEFLGFYVLRVAQMDGPFVVSPPRELIPNQISIHTLAGGPQRGGLPTDFKDSLDNDRRWIAASGKQLVKLVQLLISTPPGFGISRFGEPEGTKLPRRWIVRPLGQTQWRDHKTWGT